MAAAFLSRGLDEDGRAVDNLEDLASFVVLAVAERMLSFSLVFIKARLFFTVAATTELSQMGKRMLTFGVSLPSSGSRRSLGAHSS